MIIKAFIFSILVFCFNLCNGQNNLSFDNKDLSVEIVSKASQTDSISYSIKIENVSSKGILINPEIKSFVALKRLSIGTYTSDRLGANINHLYQEAINLNLLMPNNSLEFTTKNHHIESFGEVAVLVSYLRPDNIKRKLVKRNGCCYVIDYKKFIEHSDALHLVISLDIGTN